MTTPSITLLRRDAEDADDKGEGPPVPAYRHATPEPHRLRRIGDLARIANAATMKRRPMHLAPASGRNSTPSGVGPALGRPVSAPPPMRASIVPVTGRTAVTPERAGGGR